MLSKHPIQETTTVLKRWLAAFSVALCAAAAWAAPAHVAAPAPDADDALIALGKGIPGFGGMFRDAEGATHVYMLDPTARGAAVDKALGELARPTDETAGASVLLHRADFTFERLVAWKRALGPVLSIPGVLSLDADEAHNRVTIGIARDLATADRERLEAALDGRDAELVLVESWHDDEAFVEVVADRVRGTDAWVVFTAHSLPERILAAGDPYRDQLLETSRLVADHAGLGDRWSFAFQSASPTGEPWLGPDILDELERLHGEGVRKVLVAPVGFVSDHLEILWDLDVEGREKAAELGMELGRIESMNDDPAFIEALAGVVERAQAAEPARSGP